MKKCNVINNSQVSSTWSTVFSAHFLNIYDSCIIDNNAPYSLWCYDSNAIINVYNSVIDKKVYHGTVNIKSSISYSFKNHLVLFSTDNCVQLNMISTKRSIPQKMNRIRTNSINIFLLSCLVHVSK